MELPLNDELLFFDLVSAGFTKLRRADGFIQSCGVFVGVGAF